MGSSFYLQIAPYLLLEYIYGGTDTTYISNQVKLGRIKNNHTGFDGQVQLLNGSASQLITGNVFNTSAVRIASSRWAYLNTDVPTPYLSTDTELSYTDLSSVLTSNYVLYDRVRVHILSGYRLDDLDGLIVQVYGKEAQTSLQSILSNHVYLNNESSDVLNPKPILLGERMYDRYIEVLVPSIKSVNQDFYANPTNPASLGYQFTSNNRGFLYNTGIYVKIYEIQTTEVRNGNIFLNTSNEYEAAVNQEDLYSGLSAVVVEAEDGDYFKYYPTYGGNYVEDFLVELNSSGGDYVLINDIEVWEQVGSENISTFSFSQLQAGGFDKPIEWRPIVKYADAAVCFSIDYTVRIYNRQNNFQIIRRASTTCFHPKKYGKNIERIGLANMSYPMKVYNKIVGGPSVTYEQPTYDTSFKTVYIPVFYESKQVVIQTKSLVTSTGDTDAGGGTYFGQGDARIYISDFDTIQKFNVHRVDKKTNALTVIDLTKGDISIVFTDKIGKKISVTLDSSIAQNSRALGELVFTIPGSLKKSILYDSLPKQFDIVIETEGSSPSVIYTGSVQSSEKIAEEPSRIKEIVAQSSTLSGLVGSTSSTVTTATVSTGTSTPGKTTSLLSDLITSNSQSISSKDKQEVLQPHIPGYSNDSNAVSVKLGVKPKSPTNDKTVENKLAKTNGTTITTKSSDSSK